MAQPHDNRLLGISSREPPFFVSTEATMIDKTALRITDQFHDKGGMVYDLRCEDARLTLRMMRRGPGDTAVFSADDTGGEWHVSASSPGIDVPPVDRSAGTRADALRAIGAKWTTEMSVPARPRFDWSEVERLLALVRAI